MFDFPASPNVGDVANGYRYNGVGWAGGPIVPTPTEQFFDLSGKTSVDVPVPTWAKGLVIEGSIYHGGTGTPGVQISFDGTTFKSTTSDYSTAGPFHDSNTATPYQTQATAVSAAMNLTWGNNNANVPCSISAQMNLGGTGTQLITMRTLASNYSNAVAFRHSNITTFYTGTAAPVKALRIINVGGGAMQSGSFLRLKWLGGEVPAQNGIVPEAPQDSRTYDRRNGLWVPAGLVYVSSTTFAGKVRIDVPLPDGYKSFQLRYRNALPTATSANYLWCFGSLDGSTFAMSDGNYNWRMGYTAGTGVTMAQWVAAAGSGMGIVMMPLGMVNTVQYNFSGIIDIMQGSAAVYSNIAVNSQSMAAQGIYTQVGSGYLAIAGPWKAIRIQVGVGAGEAFQRGDLDLYGFQ